MKKAHVVVCVPTFSPSNLYVTVPKQISIICCGCLHAKVMTTVKVTEI